MYKKKKHIFESGKIMKNVILKCQVILVCPTTHTNVPQKIDALATFVISQKLYHSLVFASCTTI